MENLSHDQLVEITTSSLCTIFQSDSLLRDLPSDITIEEIESKVIRIIFNLSFKIIF